MGTFACGATTPPNGTTGEWRPVDPVEFIAGCFTSGEIPQRGEGGSNSDISLASYLEQHQVVTIMQRAVGACAAAEPAPDDPLKFVGDYIAEHRDDADNDGGGQGQKEEAQQPEEQAQEEGGEEAKAPEPEAEADAEPANE